MTIPNRRHFKGHIIIATKCSSKMQRKWSILHEKAELIEYAIVNTLFYEKGIIEQMAFPPTIAPK